MKGLAGVLPNALPVPPGVDVSVWVGLPHDLQSSVWALRNPNPGGEEGSAPDAVLVEDGSEKQTVRDRLEIPV